MQKPFFITCTNAMQKRRVGIPGQVALLNRKLMRNQNSLFVRLLCTVERNTLSFLDTLSAFSTFNSFFFQNFFALIGPSSRARLVEHIAVAILKLLQPQLI